MSLLVKSFLFSTIMIYLAGSAQQAQQSPQTAEGLNPL